MTQRDDFVRCAREQVGKPYKWATVGPNTFDCSGLVAYCYKQATGKDITRSSYEQFTLGSPVMATLDPAGVLLFWDTENNGTAGHVAIALDHDTVVHALNPERGVVISPRTANMGGPYLGARRLFLPADSPSEEEPSPKEEPPRPKRKRRERRRRERA